MFYTYVLLSESDNKFYAGFTNDLKQRFTLFTLLNAAPQPIVDGFNRVKCRRQSAKLIFNRDEQHRKGYVESTKDRRPLILIYYEACINRNDALKREKYFKSYHGKQFLYKRLNSYLSYEIL